MRIVVYGATGMIGSRVVAEATSRGHDVTAVSRRIVSAPDGADVLVSDATDTAAARELAAAHDVVVSALAPSREPGADVTGFAPMIGALARAAGDVRFVMVGGSGSLLTPTGDRRVDAPDFPEIYKKESRVVADALDVLRELGPDTDWTYLSPSPEIGPGERSGSYRVGTDEAVGARISAEDYAVALLDEIERPAHRRQRFTVAN